MMLSTRLRSLSCLGLVPALLVLCSTGVAAQATVTGQVQFGGRQLFGPRESAKFLEYRAIPEGFFLGQVDLDVDWGEPGWYLKLRADDALEGDQSIRVRAGRYGRYELRLDFNRTPHLFTNTGRSLYDVPSPGVHVMADSVQAKLRAIYDTDIDPTTSGTQRDLAALQATVNGLSRPVDVSLLREKGSASFRYTPTTSWDIQVRYSLEEMRGTRPFGATFGFNVQEQLEPIDYSTHSVETSVERSGTDWNVRVGYTGSFFRNHVDALVFDNPYLEIDASNAGSRGRIDLYPNNASHIGSLSGGVRLPLKGWWTTSVAYGTMTQNDAFLPFTINGAITGVPTLPATSANAKYVTTQINSTISLKPSSIVGLGARFRLYDRDNEKPLLTFEEGYVRTDDRVSGDRRAALPLAYTTKNASFNGTIRPAEGLAVKGLFEWEGMDREFRDVLSTSETTVGGSVDFTRPGGLLLRASYRRSDRNGTGYDAEENVANKTFPDGEVGGQMHELRKFDMADRVRDKVVLIARFAPIDRIDVSGTYTVVKDDFDNTEYGRLDRSRNIGAVSVSYMTEAGISVVADYSRETHDLFMRSRQRSPTSDEAANDWETKVDDAVNTYGVLLAGTLGEKLGLNLSYHRSDGNTLTSFDLPGTPTITITDVDFPVIVRDFQWMRADATWSLAERTDLRFEYRFEKYDQVDFSLDVMAPYMGLVDPSSAQTSWVGATRPNFRAHITSISLAYRF